MSTSDSDYSIDWLASDEDDYDSPERLGSQHKDTQTPPSSTTSPRESPQTFHSGPIERNHGDCESKDGDRQQHHRLTRGGRDSDSPTQENPWATPNQGYTVVGQHTPSWAFWTTSEGAAAGKLRQTKKRAHSPGLEGPCVRPTLEDTEKELFFQKCRELRSYIQPLASILRGLRSGRYSQRLSSFQESVAMDRIQRLMGVLQNPNMGERYVSTILKMEDMLQNWFPHVRPSPQHRSVTLRDEDSTPAKKQKHHHTTTNPPPSSQGPPEDQSSRVSDSTPAGACSPAHIKWLHTSPICSLNTSEWTSPLEVTQDNAVSSSTDLQTDPPRRRQHHHHHPPSPRPRQGPPPFKISSPCLERLLQAKESIIAPRTVGSGSSREGGSGTQSTC